VFNDVGGKHHIKAYVVKRQRAYIALLYVPKTFSSAESNGVIAHVNARHVLEAQVRQHAEVAARAGADI
jgi:hypothetical protein